MKAVRYHSHGDLDMLQVDDIALPEPGLGEALVRVEACALNHLDILQRRGPALIPGFLLPHIAGMDVAGTVVSSATLAEGTRVVLNPALPCGKCQRCLAGDDGQCPTAAVIGGSVAGGYAEFVVVPELNLHVVPSNVSMAEAAVVPTVWMTAWHALHETGKVRDGEDVLIHAAGSGVSTAAIQLAKAAGARVIATVSSAAKTGYAAELGADLVLDSSDADLVSKVRAATDGRGVDLVLDHVGPATWNAGVYSLASRGRLVFFGNTTGNRVDFDLVYAYHFGLQLLGSDPYNLREFATMLDTYWASDFVTPIDSEFDLVDARAAQERMESRAATGKIVLRT